MDLQIFSLTLAPLSYRGAGVHGAALGVVELAWEGAQAASWLVGSPTLGTPKAFWWLDNAIYCVVQSKIEATHAKKNNPRNGEVTHKRPGVS